MRFEEEGSVADIEIAGYSGGICNEKCMEFELAWREMHVGWG